jgi:hypothetical protein
MTRDDLTARRKAACSLSALMCSHCGTTFAAADACPKCFPHRDAKDQLAGTTRVAPSAAGAGSGLLHRQNMRHIEQQWFSVRTPAARAASDRMERLTRLRRSRTTLHARLATIGEDA